MKANLPYFLRSVAPRVLAAALALGASAGAQAALTDLAAAPLETSSSGNVQPNLLFTLDQSGSMAWDHLPDYVQDGSFCKSSGGTTSCNTGDVPWYAAAFNGVAYNPQITYLPGVTYQGVSMGSQTTWTSVKVDPYTSGATINLVTSFSETQFCNNSGVCQRNGYTAGVNPGTPFDYWNTAYPTGAYTRATTKNSNPYYFDIVPKEYCSDQKLSNCVLSAVPTGVYQNPAPMRFCKTQAQASSTAAVSDPIGTASPQCISKYVSQPGMPAYTQARYGNFQRTDIVPTTTTYGNRPNRFDCAAAPNCTYAEEMTNFSNWYAYYRTRINMMKSAVGLAFANMNANYRIGFITIHPPNPISPGNGWVPVNTFNATQKQTFYNAFYSQIPNGDTPLRTALARAGRYFAHVTNGINQGITDDPMQYSCQPNYLLMTTDGFWNTGDPYDLAGNDMANTDVDNTGVGYATRSSGSYDGNIGAVGTLADTAMYYYETDLRNPSLGNCTSGATGQDTCKDNVPISSADPNPQQHMTVFTVGMADGLLRYQSNYPTAISGDFYSIKTAGSGCFWAAGVCNWPLPVANDQSALDDLWHAAVNARGQFFKATNPTALIRGLNTALSAMQARDSAAAAAATSTPNVTQTNNFIFSTTYETSSWTGQVEAQHIDTTTGNVIPAVLWSSQSQIDALTPATRTVYFNGGVTLKPFLYANLPANLQAYFANQCVKLSQCNTLSAPQQVTANDGNQLVNFLLGDRSNEGTVFRTRTHLLGDTVDAAPVYVAAPTEQFGDAVNPSYATWAAAQAGRQPMLYVAANDGMLHAINATTGAEMWAYVPTMVMQNMYVLADMSYSAMHTFFVDGTPEVMDAYFNGNWHTVLVGGLNKGGRGYYALDITNPSSPLILWEDCDDATICKPANTDANIGYTYGNPVITKRASDERWVVLFTSGYNNVTPGDGMGRLYVADVATGAILSVTSTNTGSTTTPSGLAQITALANNFSVDDTTLTVYGGDLLGNVWRFDLTAAPPTVVRLAELTDPNGNPQPITTKPEVTLINNQRVLYVATGSYLGVSDLSTTQVQTVYAFKDTVSDLGKLRTRGDIVANTPTLNGTTITIANLGTPVNWATQSGWRVDLPQAGQRVSVDPQLIEGTLLVIANLPDTTVCSAGGQSFLYQFNFMNPQAVPSALNGTTLGQMIGNAIAVGLTVLKLPSGAIKAIIPLADTTKPTEAVNISSGTVTTRRTGWRQMRN